MKKIEAHEQSELEILKEKIDDLETEIEDQKDEIKQITRKAEGHQQDYDKICACKKDWLKLIESMQDALSELEEEIKNTL